MKNKLILAAVLASMSFGANVQAFCSGTIVPDNDCDSNQESYSFSCCPAGYRVHGVVYNDFKDSDVTDAVGAVCRKYKGDEVMISSDFQNSRNHSHRSSEQQKGTVQLVCQPKEVMAGIACKDTADKKEDNDSLDGCTPVCQVPGKEKIAMANPDIDSNRRDFVYHWVDLPNRVVGLGYKEERNHTDKADCANVSYKHLPIVKP